MSLIDSNSILKRIRKTYRDFPFILFILPKKLIYKFLSNIKHLEGRPNIYQPVLLLGEGKIVFGQKVKIGVIKGPFFLSSNSHIEARKKDSHIYIGDETITNNCIVIIAEHGKIEIGKKVLIGNNVTILNSNFHNSSIFNRYSENKDYKDVKISDYVFIGSNVTILKGVTIGENSIIANGSIVTKSFPSNSIIGGIPAKLLKSINE